MSQDWLTIISNVGFPIAACAWMALSQKPALDRMKEAVDNNTMMMEKLIDRMDNKE